MRDLMSFLPACLMVYVALRHGFAAYFLWGWTGLMVPTVYFYGFMLQFRFNFLFAVIAMGMLLLGRVTDRGQFKVTRTGVLMTIFFVHVGLCTALAMSPNPLNARIFEQFTKSFAFIILMPFFVHGRLRLHAMMVMFALGLGFHGTVEGLKVIASGGGHKVQGLIANILSDNNHFAVGMAVALPVLYYLFQHTGAKWVRLGFLAVLGLTVATILGTGSRGGFLSMAMVGTWIALTSRRKGRAMLWVTLAAVGVLLLAPGHWFERIDTIGEASMDDSFMGRVAAWKVSSAIALANPVFGGGLHAVQQPWIWHQFQFAPSLLSGITVLPLDFPKAAHSIYFEVLGDTGLVGLGLFLVLMANGVATRFEIASLAKKAGSSGAWARDMADMLSVALMAYLVGGAGVSLAYFEGIYVILMMLELIKQELLKLAPARAPVAAAQPAPPMAARRAGS